MKDEMRCGAVQLLSPLPFIILRMSVFFADWSHRRRSRALRQDFSVGQGGSPLVG